MRTRTLRGIYRPNGGLLHDLPLGWKTMLLIAYIIAVLNIDDVLVLAVFSLMIGTTARLMGTSGIGRAAIALILSAALFRLVDIPALRLFTSFLFALARVSFINQLLRWYSESIHYSQLFALGQGSKGTQIGGEFLFFIASNLTTYPLIERDLRLALDAERLRLGHLPRLWMIGTWLNVLTNVLVRGLERADSVSHSVTERGFSFDTPFTINPTERVTGTRFAFALLTFLPPLIIVVMRLL